VTGSNRGAPADTRRPRSVAARAALALAAFGLFAGFVALGSWQLERRAWKLDLIARVEQRVHAAPVAAPGPIDWPLVSAARDEYRRVRVHGAFLHDREALVQASTALGAGYWVLTPLRTVEGPVVLVNRGFVPPELRDRARRPEAAPNAEATVTGLLRLSEPGGSFLRRNDPGADRWASRDVAAIAAQRGLHDAAPYFIDAEMPPRAPGEPAAPAAPVGGLTVIAFPNNHLEYAITWYSLALLVALAAGYAARSEWRRDRAGAEA
jgi:surfeit locus 1 family protein